MTLQHWQRAEGLSLSLLRILRMTMLERLARQALSSDQPVKLSMTIPSQKEMPSSCFRRRRACSRLAILVLSIQRAPRQLLEAAELRSRVRVPETRILLRAAGRSRLHPCRCRRKEETCVGSAETLRQRLTRCLRGPVSKTRLGSRGTHRRVNTEPVEFTTIRTTLPNCES